MSAFRRGRAVGSLLCLTHLAAAGLPVDVAGWTPSETTFQGFGTSLCWWARGVGGWSNSTAFDELMDLLFDPSHPEGLKLNMVRYNIGGGSLHDPSLAHFRTGGWVPSYESGPGVWDWSQDAEQRRVLHAALQRGVRYAMAFSNSPPAWMTVSGSSTGSATGTTDNLRQDQYGAFADYLANVTAHFHTNWNVTFDSVTPLNEAANGWWKTGGSQEGCHFDQSSESKIVAALGSALKSLGAGAVLVSGPEENSIDTSLQSLKTWTASAVDALGVVTTHTYNGNNRAAISDFAAQHKKRLWASEYGTGSGPLQGGVQLAQRIIKDFVGMTNMEVWTLWQAADLDNSMSPQGWGLTAASFCGCGGGETCTCPPRTPFGAYYVRKQYFALRQFSAFLRPGSQVLHPSSTQDALPENTLLAVDPDGSTLVFVVNPTTSPNSFALEGLGAQNGCAEHVVTDAIRSTSSVEFITVTGGKLAATISPESVNTFVVRSGTGSLCPPAPPPKPVRIRLLNESGLCLTCTEQRSISLQQCTSDSTSLQTWLWPTNDVGAITLAASVGSVDDALCLTWIGESAAVGVDRCTQATSNQQWALTSNRASIAGVGSESMCKWKWGSAACCLDDWNRGEHAGDPVYTYSCWGGNSQKWVVQPVSNRSLGGVF